MIKQTHDYLLDTEYNKKVITAYINNVIPTMIDINDHLNALSPYSENIINNQDSIPTIMIPNLTPFNSLSTNFFSIITFPLLFVSIHIQVLTFLEVAIKNQRRNTTDVTPQK
jgi:hypothetical protein